jgi:exodeoxyribonuclease VII large subunit
MSIPVLLSPAKVQGPEAPYELTQALRRLAQVPEVDVIIIGRGGGSIEDLWAFNHEGLTRAISTCVIPIVSAVGHEVDVTLCDLVADRRAATPSQAGELVVPDRHALLDRLADRQRRLSRNLERRVLDLGARLHARSNRLERWGRSFVWREREQLQVARRRMLASTRAALSAERRRHRELAERLATVHPRARIATERAHLHDLERRLLQAGRGLTASLRPQFARAAGKLDALSPLAVLGRGYALVRDHAGTLVRDAAAVEPGERLRVQLQLGEIDVAVCGKTESEGPS